MSPSLLSSPSRSSLATSVPSEPTPYSGSSVSSGAHALRRSVTLIVPTNLSTFIRSQGAISRRHNSVHQLKDIRFETLDYAGHRRTMEHQRTKSTALDEDGLSRKPQKNRFYNFLRHSRSRSRSKATEEIVSPPELPTLDFMTQFDVPVIPTSPEHVDPSKPPTRLPSRPLSSTTTATNATVLPPTPTQTRRQRRHPPVHDTQPTLPAFPIHDAYSRSSTPKPSATRQKLHDLFGIPLPHSRKSSLSRPASPDLFQDAPPLPRTFAGLNVMSNTSNDQKFTSQTHDLAPSHSIQHSAGWPGTNPAKEKTRAFHSSKLDFFRSSRMFSTSGRSKRFTSSPSRIPASDPTSTLELSSPLQSSVSAPTPAPVIPFFKSISDNHFPLHNAEIIDASIPKNDLESPSGYSPDAEPTSTISPDTHSPHAMLIPKIIQTPPTPAKSVETTPAANHRRKSSDLKSKPGAPRPLAVVGEENLMKQGDEDRGRRLERERGTWSQRLPSPKFFGGKDAKEKTHGKEGGKSLQQGRLVIAVTHSTNQTPRRPGTTESRKVQSRGDAGNNVARSSSLIGNGRTKHGSFDFEKPVWSFGGGRAGSSVTRSGYSRSGDSLQSGISTSTRSTRHIERSVSSSHRPLENDSIYNRTPASSSNHLTPAASTSSHATSYSNVHARSYSVTTPTPSDTAQPSSLGRAASKRTAGNLPAGLAHGPFSFEPPIPPPPSAGSSARFETAGRVDAPRESYSQKVGRKGRSLDLGLGLAWAPSKVKKEALMPFGRTLSRESEIQNAHESRNKPVSGADVTNTFREVLDEAGFAKFKKYVHRFDAHAIPFDGQSGIVSRVEKLLDKSPYLDEEGRRDLLNRFIRVILQNA